VGFGPLLAEFGDEDAHDWRKGFGRCCMREQAISLPIYKEKSMKKMYLPAIAATIFAVPTLAMEVADADGDGAFSLAELATTYPTLTEEAFGGMDVDQDGVINAEEFARALELDLLPKSEG
jgi:hypothetical protein